MQFQIGRYTLDVEHRVLNHDEHRQPVRPKTLSLMLLLIEHQHQVISKQTLLEKVWDDVTVSEGVVFQTISEIRHLFPDITVIQNHPRKGYQWVAPVTRIGGPVAQDVGSKSLWQKMLLPAFALTILLAAIVIYLTMPPSNTGSVMLLPLKSYIDRNDLPELVPVGTKALATHLEQLDGLSVAIAKPLAESQAQIVHDWYLATSIYGDVYDFKLVFNLESSEERVRGVVFSHEFSTALADLSSAIELIVNGQSYASSDLPNNVYIDSQLARAIVMYETDWQTAIDILKAYVQQHPDIPVASLYLARLYVWQQQYGLAQKLVSDTLAKGYLPAHLEAELLYIHAKAQLSEDAESALATITQAITLTASEPTWLVRGKLEELRADILLRQDDPVAALRGYLQAQSFYDQIGSPVEAAGLQLKLAAFYMQQGDMAMAQRAYQQGKLNIQQKEMSFLYAALAEFELEFPELVYR